MTLQKTLPDGSERAKCSPFDTSRFCLKPRSIKLPDTLRATAIGILPVEDRSTIRLFLGIAFEAPCRMLDGLLSDAGQRVLAGFCCSHLFHSSTKDAAIRITPSRRDLRRFSTNADFD